MQQNTSLGQLLRLPAVASHTGLSKSEIYRRIKCGVFPKPIKLGPRSVAWPAGQIDGWIKSVIGQASK